MSWKVPLSSGPVMLRLPVRHWTRAMDEEARGQRADQRVDPEHDDDDTVEEADEQRADHGDQDADATPACPS